MSIENCYNILILGNENVGKTTYINRLITGDFTCEDLVKKTLKISYQKQKKNEVCLFKFIEKQTIDDSIDEICDGCILLFDLTDQTSFDDLETKYINQLNPMELIVLKIAKEHLQTSFDLKKSIGYKNWLKTLSDGA